MNILIYIAIGLSIGSLSGVLGIGGGVLIVPALIWLCDFDARKAVGTTLAIMVPPIGMPAALRYYSAGFMDLQAALWIAGAFLVGAYLGATAAPYLPERSLRVLFGLGMMYIAFRFMVSTDVAAADAAAGLVAMVCAWVAFLCLRLVGRRVPRPRSLHQQIEAGHQHGRGEVDYYI